MLDFPGVKQATAGELRNCKESMDGAGRTGLVTFRHQDGWSVPQKPRITGQSQVPIFLGVGRTYFLNLTCLGYAHRSASYRIE